jgi:indole-3-glycerol phosphate synthase
MSSRLTEILVATSERLAEARSRLPEPELRARIKDLPPAQDFAAALTRPGRGSPGAAPLRVIAEIKRRSPSAGAIFEEVDPASAAQALVTAGAAAISVVTEPHFFGGSLEAMAQVRAATSAPLLRKDFLLDSYQVLEARLYGADAVLLLAAVIDDGTIRQCVEEAERCGIAVLAEAHGEEELERLIALGLPIIGLNARDLHSFEVDVERVLRWCEAIPSDRISVAESGITTRAQADAVTAAPVDAALVGEGLMRGGDPAARFRALFGMSAPA